MLWVYTSTIVTFLFNSKTIRNNTYECFIEYFSTAERSCSVFAYLLCSKPLPTAISINCYIFPKFITKLLSNFLFAYQQVPASMPLIFLDHFCIASWQQQVRCKILQSRFLSIYQKLVSLFLQVLHSTVPLF